MAFKDHFSRQAAQYTLFRPRYPRALFEFLAALPEQRDRAWDCGTGSGQAAVALAEFFDDVLATDPSAAQIAHAERHPRVQYVVSAAEHAPLADHSVDLVTVAQALHWFDLDRFYAEVRRVVRPAGAVAVWSYGLGKISPQVDSVVWHLYKDILDPYWPPERGMIEQRYAQVAFPFEELTTPRLAMTADWKMNEFVGYLGTWSAVQRYIERNAANPIERVRAELEAAWGAAGAARRITWPLFLRVGRPGAATP